MYNFLFLKHFLFFFFQRVHIFVGKQQAWWYSLKKTSERSDIGRKQVFNSIFDLGTGAR